MTDTGRSLPKDVIAHWPEVFGEVHLNVLPIRYLHTVLVNFKDGKSWEIKITAQTRKEGWEKFEQNLSEMLRNYNDSVDNVDFKLDSVRVRKDVERSTQQFLRKKKL